jgi:hypothetical protein
MMEKNRRTARPLNLLFEMVDRCFDNRAGQLKV